MGNLIGDVAGYTFKEAVHLLLGPPCAAWTTDLPNNLHRGSIVFVIFDGIAGCGDKKDERLFNALSNAALLAGAVAFRNTTPAKDLALVIQTITGIEAPPASIIYLGTNAALLVVGIISTLFGPDDPEKPKTPIEKAWSDIEKIVKGAGQVVEGGVDLLMDSVNRGVGIIPSVCKLGTTKQTGLCYGGCLKPGYGKPQGPACAWSGGFCGCDTGFTQKHGQLCYRPGKTKFWNAVKPTCYGRLSGRGVGTIPTECPPPQCLNESGLCYRPAPRRFDADGNPITYYCIGTDCYPYAALEKIGHTFGSAPPTKTSTVCPYWPYPKGSSRGTVWTTVVDPLTGCKVATSMEGGFHIDVFDCPDKPPGQPLPSRPAPPVFPAPAPTPTPKPPRFPAPGQKSASLAPGQKPTFPAPKAAGDHTLGSKADYYRGVFAPRGGIR
jgi:hypothetical protein